MSGKLFHSSHYTPQGSFSFRSSHHCRDNLRSNDCWYAKEIPQPSKLTSFFWISNFKNIYNEFGALGLSQPYILTVCRIQLRAGSGNSSSTLTALALKPTIRSCLGASSFLRTWRLRWKNTEQLEEWKISGPHLIILLVGDWCFLSSLFWDLVLGQPPISKETQSLIDYQPAMFFWLLISRQLVHIKSEKG